MQVITTETKVFTFDELSEDAKETARAHWRHCGLDYQWWDGVFTDFEEIAPILGVTIDRDPNRPSQPAIWFDAVYNGSASYAGEYEYRKSWRQALGLYAPKESELFRIGESLQAAQKSNFYAAEALISGLRLGYSSMDVSVMRNDDSELAEGTEDEIIEALRDLFVCGYSSMDVSVMRNDDSELAEGTEDEIIEALRDLAEWLHSALVRECEYLMSDEVVDESLTVNDYTFTEDGNLHIHSAHAHQWWA